MAAKRHVCRLLFDKYHNAPLIDAVPMLLLSLKVYVFFFEEKRPSLKLKTRTKPHLQFGAI